MAPFSSPVIRAVTTRTFLVYVSVCARRPLCLMWRGFSCCSLKALLLHCHLWRHTGSPTRATKTFGRYGPCIRPVSLSNSASQHEWAAHGTCFSTLELSCLPSGSPTGAEAVAYFKQVVALFETLPTYTWLESQGITPDATQTYALSDLISALQTASGGVRCPASTISDTLLIKGIYSSLQPLAALDPPSIRSAGISIFKVPFLMEILSLSVREP